MSSHVFAVYNWVLCWVWFARHLDSTGGPGLSLGGYYCPQCRAKYTELPVECRVCGKYLTNLLNRRSTTSTVQFQQLRFLQNSNTYAVRSPPCPSCFLVHRPDIGVCSSPGPILPPPLPSGHLPGESSGGAHRREVSPPTGTVKVIDMGPYWTVFSTLYMFSLYVKAVSVKFPPHIFWYFYHMKLPLG